MSDNRVFAKSKGVEYWVRQVHLSDRFLEIVVKETMLPEAKIASLLFKTGELPEGASLTSDIGIGEERWRVSWTGNDLAFASLLRSPFRSVMIYPDSYVLGWEDRVAKRKERLERWRRTPQRHLGGLTPTQLVSKGKGPYDIVGQGFAWIGTLDGTVIQTRSYYDSPVLNRDMHWYLAHGASIRQAVTMLNAQWRSINRQMLAAWIGVMQGVAGASKGTAPADHTRLSGRAAEKLEIKEAWRIQKKVAGELMKKTGYMQDSGDLVKKGLDHKLFIDSRNEERIRQLAQKPTVPVVEIQPKWMSDDLADFFEAVTYARD